MSEKKKNEQPTAESSLAPQIGTDNTDIATGKTDMRRLSKTGPLDKAWIAYFLLLEPEEGGEFARAFCSNYLNLAVSEDGWRVNKMIQAIGASKGIAGTGELVSKPGFIARHTYKRNWDKEAERKGQTVVE